MGSLLKLIRWLLEKAAMAGLIVVLGLAACGLWMFLKDNVDFDEWRQDLIRSINGERSKVQSALADVNQRLDRITADTAAEQERTRQADKVIAQLQDLSSTWDKLTGDAQQKANTARLEKMQQLRKDSVAHTAVLQGEFNRTTWERDGLEIALGKLDARLRAVEAKRSKVMHYLEQVWNHPLGRFRVKWWVITALLLYFLGPTAGKAAMYFAVAPVISRGRPVRLAPGMTALPEIATSSVAADVVLQPGDRLWVKEKFLQASDEGLARRTRFVLDWRIPFTCFASGLMELIELANRQPAGGYAATLSNQSNPHSELAIVTLAPGSALVLRPSFLAGAIIAAGQRLVIRRRWQLFRWQAWVTLQFRFFEFSGPCRLVIAGSRGVRAERLVEREGHAQPARRTNQDATIGFTPNLDYRPVRAETFWSYYRGMNPLFDDLFAGPGLFLCQQTAADGDASTARKFWSSVWGGVLKVFGL